MRRTLPTTAALVLTAGVVTAVIASTGVASAATAPAAPASSPVHFAAGSTSGTVSGQLAAGGERRFTFGARAEQVATVHLTRGNATERWTLTGPDGDVLHGQTTEQQRDVSVRLPSAGTYRLTVLTTDAGSYALRLSIPR